MTDLSAIQGWIANVQSTLSGLPAAFAEAARSGDFAAVLAEAQSALASQPATAPPAASPTGLVASSALSATGRSGQSQPGPLTSAATRAAAGGPTAAQVVSTAEQYLGVPYLWGGTTPQGFDCSGFVQYVYAELGISLPRTSEEQATVGTPVPSLAQARPGDLVFFAGSDGTPSAPGHVGIYLGDGEMIDAPQTGETVSIQPVGVPVEIRRVLPTPPATTWTGQAGSSPPSPGAPSQPSPSATPPPPSLVPLFDSAARRYGVPARLLEAVAQVESGYSTTEVSPAGALGLMQLMPKTAAGLGVDPLDPAQAIDGAAELLSRYLAQYGSLTLALAAYNAGPVAVAAYGGVPPYPETQSYVQQVTSILRGAA